MNKKKFRIWEIQDKKYLDEMDWHLVDLNEVFNYEGYVVQMWTNMIDANGVEIYEGDIVSVRWPDNLFEVKFGKIHRDVLCRREVGRIWPLEFNGFYFENITTKEPCLSIIHNELGIHDLSETRVVGNIFQK